MKLLSITTSVGKIILNPAQIESMEAANAMSTDVRMVSGILYVAQEKQNEVGHRWLLALEGK